MAALGELGWIDLALLAVFAVSALIGLWRGLVYEFVALLSWVVAYVIANAGGPLLAQWLPWGGPDSALRTWGSFAIVFVVVLALCMVLARVLRALVSATPLSIIDRLLGLVFGAARAVVVGLVLTTLIAQSPLSDWSAWRTSQGALWLGQTLEALKPLVPNGLNLQLAA